MALQPGDVLQQRCSIQVAIKSGGFGAVFKAHDSQLDGVCAVKEMHPSGDSWAQRRFREEAGLLSTLQHANIPKVRDFFVLDCEGQPLHYLVMDYVEGETLHHELTQAMEAGRPGMGAEAGIWLTPEFS